MNVYRVTYYNFKQEVIKELIVAEDVKEVVKCVESDVGKVAEVHFLGKLGRIYADIEEMSAYIA